MHWKGIHLEEVISQLSHMFSEHTRHQGHQATSQLVYTPLVPSMVCTWWCVSVHMIRCMLGGIVVDSRIMGSGIWEVDSSTYVLCYALPCVKGNKLLVVMY